MSVPVEHNIKTVVLKKEGIDIIENLQLSVLYMCILFQSVSMLPQPKQIIRM